MMIATPIDEISGTSVPALRARSGANATRSSRMPMMPAEHRGAGERERQRHARRGERERGERGGREDRRVRQIEDVEHAEHQRVPDREQRVDRAQKQPVERAAARSLRAFLMKVREAVFHDRQDDRGRLYVAVGVEADRAEDGLDHAHVLEPGWSSRPWSSRRARPGTRRSARRRTTARRTGRDLCRTSPCSASRSRRSRDTSRRRTRRRRRRCPARPVRRRCTSRAS